MGLSQDLAGRVLARVGERVITLGDYAAALERMDPFERLRYQTADRRKQLLEEMIDLELLAQEAEARKLDETPAARQMVRQILRAEILRELREQQPKLEDIPSSKVRAYYEAHRDEFREPERRRLSAIVVPSAALAEQLLPKAVAAGAQAFGELVEAHSMARRPKDRGPRPPTELAGDLGFLRAPGPGVPPNPDVPDAVRAAAFEIEEQGDVLGRVVEADGRHYILRLVSVSAARDRSFPEAERTIRVALLRNEIQEAEAEYEQELRKRFPVTIDDEALAKVERPSASERKEP
jgi:hypothetical protein